MAELGDYVHKKAYLVCKGNMEGVIIPCPDNSTFYSFAHIISHDGLPAVEYFNLRPGDVHVSPKAYGQPVDIVDNGHTPYFKCGVIMRKEDVDRVLADMARR